MAPTTESARLRVVGQELAQRKICDFEVTVDPDGYHVRGFGIQEPAKQPPAPRGKWSLRGLLKPRTAAPPPEDEDCGPGEWEQHYTLSDIDRLDGWYRARRARAGTPDDYSASEVLRVIGAYVDQRHWKLVGVSRSRQTIGIQHEDSQGQLQTAEQNYADLYDFSYHMFKSRSREGGGPGQRSAAS